MADQLGLYNSALGYLQERPLASLRENREARRILDIFFTEVVNYCLGQGLWLFAKRMVSITPSKTVNGPAFGWLFVFDVPTDWIRTIQVSGDPAFLLPLNDLAEQPGIWLANTQPIYVAYVSSSPQYGLNLGGWGEAFEEYVAIRLAVKACPRVARGNLPLLMELKKQERLARIDARSKDAMNEAIGQRPLGTWVRSRRFGLPFGGLFGPGSSTMGPTGNDF